ncbi:MAG: HD domain-containing protein [Eubacteriales bacterium]|nr:HD domain-containing protein [Eubacteriales bacterium]
MKYINSFTDGCHVRDIYLCRSKTIALTKNGKEYANVVLQDRTGQIEAKIWNLNDPAICEFEATDYVHVDAVVTVFNGANQLNVHRIRRADNGEYSPADYFPVSERPFEEMKNELFGYIKSIENPYYGKLLCSFFEDPVFLKDFLDHSAAKSVHHSFIGGLMEHTLSVAWLCNDAAKHYPYINRDLLLTGALLHDIGKTKELSLFPLNDYTDEGQLLGHISIGAAMVSEKIHKIQGFPSVDGNQLIHLILSHHGEFEYGSPKRPALMEAFILSLLDNLDAKVETVKELVESKAPVNESGWLGYSKILDTNVRKTK